MWNWYWHSMIFCFALCWLGLSSLFAVDWRMGKPTLFYTYTDLIPSVFSMKLKQIKPKAIFPPLWISLTFKILQLNASSWYVKIKLWIPHIKSLWSTRLWENYCLISFSFISDCRYSNSGHMQSAFNWGFVWNFVSFDARFQSYNVRLWGDQKGS